MNVTTIGVALTQIGSKAIGAISGIGTGALTIGSGVSIAVTATSVGIMAAGKTLYNQHNCEDITAWQKTGIKVAGMALIILGGLLGLASSVATGVFSAIGLSALGTATLGPLGTKLGLTAGIALGVGSLVGVVIAFVKCVKRTDPDITRGPFNNYVPISDSDEKLE